MVSSYLVCELCGRFGPPASNFSLDGLRVCTLCWYEAQQSAASPVSDPDLRDKATTEHQATISNPIKIDPD